MFVPEYVWEGGSKKLCSNAEPFVSLKSFERSHSLACNRSIPTGSETKYYLRVRLFECEVEWSRSIVCLARGEIELSERSGSKSGIFSSDLG